MKTTLSIILLSLLLTTGLVSCSQSENSKEIQEIEESISASDYEKAKAEWIKRTDARMAEIEEINRKALEELASTPEGRKEMNKTLLRLKNTYLEDGMLVFKLDLPSALKLGFTEKEYNDIISGHSYYNHIVDSMRTDGINRNITIITHDYETNAPYEAARNGTHEYYKYLKKYQTEEPAIPSLRDR